VNDRAIGRKIPLIERPVFVDGITRAGKFFLGKLTAGFEHMENFQYVSLLEHLPYLERFGHLAEDACMALLQINVDEHAYHLRIGRNLNFRFDDLSSLYNTFEPDRYLKRSVSGISANIVEEIKKDGRRSLFVLHESLPNIEIFFKTFPQMQWINLTRHPVDIIHSWYLRGWGRRFGTDELSFEPSIIGKTVPIPWSASDWKEEYEVMSEADRVIRSVAALTAWGEEAYLPLTERQKAQIHTTSYERIISNTNEELEAMGSFLKMDISRRMAMILAREQLPRSLDLKQRTKKIEDIRGLASKDMFDLMMHLSARYENDDFCYQKVKL
jgi:hypothetical protein